MNDSPAENPWRDAVLDALVTWNIYAREHDTDPRKALHDLLSTEVETALDPLVSERAFALTQPDTELLRAVAELSAAMGCPAVYASAPRTVYSQTVRLAIERLRKAEQQPHGLPPGFALEDLSAVADGLDCYEENAVQVDGRIGEYVYVESTAAYAARFIRAVLSGTTLQEVAVVEDWPDDRRPVGIVPLTDLKVLPIGTKLYAVLPTEPKEEREQRLRQALTQVFDIKEQKP